MADRDITSSGDLNFVPNVKFKSIPQFIDTVVETNTNFTIGLTTGRYWAVTTGASDRVCTLPSVSDPSVKGRLLTVTKVDAGAGKITFSQDINGDSAYEVTDQFGGVTITSDGTNWYTIGGGGAASGFGIFTKSFVVGDFTTSTNLTSIDTMYRGVGTYYLDSADNHRFKFNIAFACTGSSATQHNFAFNGTTFKSGSFNFQPVALRTATGGQSEAHTEPNTGELRVQHTTSQSGGNWGFSGDLELESKPTWAP